MALWNSTLPPINNIRKEVSEGQNHLLVCLSGFENYSPQGLLGF